VSDPPLRLQFDVQGELLEAARECEAEVFSARFGYTAEELTESYARYDAQTHFLVVTDHADRVLAASRLVFPGPGGLPTMDDVAAPPWSVDPFQVAELAGLDLDRTLDGATFAVRDGLRRQGYAASHVLLHGMFAAMLANRLPSLLCIIDAVPNEMLRALGLIFTTLPGTSTQPYYASPASTPMYAHLTDLLAGQQRLAPQAHRAIGEGIGLAGVVVPPVHKFRLR
jgi:hypothetical protein